LMGNASEIDIEQIGREFDSVLIEDEKLIRVFKLYRDLFSFTNKRVLMVDKQGISGRKIDYHSIPYHSITHFAFEMAGTIDLDAEMKIWTSGDTYPMKKKFTKDMDITGIQQTLARFVLR